VVGFVQVRIGEDANTEPVRSTRPHLAAVIPRRPHDASSQAGERVPTRRTAIHPLPVAMTTPA
jgi:hypothetical protein